MRLGGRHIPHGSGPVRRENWLRRKQNIAVEGAEFNLVPWREGRKTGVVAVKLGFAGGRREESAPFNPHLIP